MPCFLKRTWAEINLDNLEYNYRAIRRYIRKDCKIMAVVKADAYGNGAVFAAKEFQSLGADCFGVSNIEEAEQIRDCGITRDILILGHTPVEYTEKLVSLNITQTVGSLEYAEALSAEAQKLGTAIKAHIKIDTGMSRIGFLAHSAEQRDASAGRIVKAVGLPGLDAEGIFTHFAVSDEPEKDFTRIQFERFTGMIHILEGMDVKFRVKHCCNSAGLLNFPEMQLDMVRPGIILYGLTPAAGMPLPIELKPVMSLKSAVTQTKTIGPDTTLSYGRIYTTERETSVATIPVGYADGFVRSLSNSADVLIHGRRARIIGRICMDQCMADITGIDGVKAGDTAVIIGSDAGQCVPMEETAEKMGTINYEVSCLIGKRVPRVYYKDGKNIGTLNYILP